MPPSPNPMIRSFLRSTRWAPSTRRITTWVLHNFAAWLTERGATLLGAGRDDIEAYLAAREAAGLAPNTVRNDWRALRGFYRWLADEGEIDADPTRRVPGPRVAETPVRVLSEGEYKALVRACGRSSTMGRRDEAILSLLWHSGLRRGELVALDVAAVDLDRGRITVGNVASPTKTGRVRRAPLAGETVDALERYLRRRDVDDDGPLFVSQRGDRLGDGGLTMMLQRRATQAGISRRIGAHEFRRAFATRYKRRGGSDPALMAIAGWKSPAMVMRYTRMESEELAAEEFRRLDDSAPRRRRRLRSAG